MESFWELHLTPEFLLKFRLFVFGFTLKSASQFLKELFRLFFWELLQFPSSQNRETVTKKIKLYKTWREESIVLVHDFS